MLLFVNLNLFIYQYSLIKYGYIYMRITDTDAWRITFFCGVRVVQRIPYNEASQFQLCSECFVQINDQSTVHLRRIHTQVRATDLYIYVLCRSVVRAHLYKTQVIQVRWFIPHHWNTFYLGCVILNDKVSLRRS